MDKSKENEDEEETDDIEDYNRIVQILHSKGMPLSLNEKINVLEGKIGYWNGVLETLKEKKHE